MKKFKIYNLLSLVACFLLVFSCHTDDNVEDKAPVTQADAGSLIEVSGPVSNKILGLPVNADDLDNTTVNFQEFDLKIDVENVYNVPTQVDSYKLYVQRNGEPRIELAQFESLPYEYNFETLNDLLAVGNWSETDLRIGDVFEFSVGILQSSGDEFASQSTYSTTVNCSSNLAGEYSVVTTRDDGSTLDFGVQTITEITPGNYRAETTGLWAAGSLRPDQSYTFSDVCGVITVPEQNLFDYYSNLVYSTEDATGNVAIDGTITVIYTIEFSSGNSIYTTVYTPQ